MLCWCIGANDPQCSRNVGSKRQLGLLGVKGLLVVVRGDSQLIVNFMLKKYKPGAEFSAGVRAMRDTCGKWRKER